MARVFTAKNPSSLLGAEKVEKYENGVWYCYGPEKDGKYELLAIIEESKTGFVVDAEDKVVARIPLATPTLEKPKPLFDTLIKAYGKIALHTGIKIDNEYYFGHKVLQDSPSVITWEEIRKREYQIVIHEPVPELDLKEINRVK